MEEWRSVKGYEGLYEVSSYGRVRNSHGVIIKPHDNGNGVLVVDLYGKTDANGFITVRHAKRKRVHRLVGNSFIDNKEGYRFLIHIDGDKHNNNVNNLYWNINSAGESK